MTTRLFRIVGWSDHFENNRTRELKNMAWVPLPNKHDGDGYTELLDHENGAAHFGAWVAIVQVASKCDPRGTLLRDCKKPHDVRSLSRMTRVPDNVLSEAISRLIEIGWVEAENGVPDTVKPIPQEGATISQEGTVQIAPHRQEGKGREGKEQKGTECTSARTRRAADSSNEVVAWSASDGWSGIGEKELSEWSEAYPACDLSRQLAAANQWLLANPTKARKTNWRRFIVNWLTRAQERGGDAKSNPSAGHEETAIDRHLKKIEMEAADVKRG